MRWAKMHPDVNVNGSSDEAFVIASDGVLLRPSSHSAEVEDFHSTFGESGNAFLEMGR